MIYFNCYITFYEDIFFTIEMTSSSAWLRFASSIVGSDCDGVGIFACYLLSKAAITQYVKRTCIYFYCKQGMCLLKD